MDGAKLHEIIHSYFKEIFTSSKCQSDDFAYLSFPQVTPEYNAKLLRPFCSEEVKVAIFSMKPDKAPSPDGMNPIFFLHFWFVIGEDVTRFIIECQDKNNFPIGFGDANIVLIPKKECVEGVADMHPIALCNTCYKIVAKMLANRMKVILKDII